MAAVLGGGLGGLAAAYYLVRAGRADACGALRLLEAGASAGGWIKSLRTDDYVFEQGPRTIRPKGPHARHTLDMISDLGLSEHVSSVAHDHPAARNRMIYVNGRLYTLPSSLRSVFRKSEPFSKPLIYALFNDLKNPHKILPDDSIYNFVERRFGKEIADYAISPMICGICAGDAKEISVKFLLNSLFEYEQNHGGVVRGALKSMFTNKGDKNVDVSDLTRKSQEEKWNVYSIKGGLEILPLTLKEHLQENQVSINFNSEVDHIEFVDSSTAILKGNLSTGGTEIAASHVYSAIPAHRLANLVQKQHPKLASNLKQIPFVTVGLVNLYFAGKNHLTQPGFGFLVPPIENSKILGVVFDSCCMPDQNGTVLTVMIGGRWFKERLGENPSKDTILNIALTEVKSILKIDATPTAYNVNILEKCIPQYVIGHYSRVEEIRKYIQDHNLPISLIGCSYDGVSVNDVIASAKKQIEKDSFR